jgi:hypothetical protein
MSSIVTGYWLGSQRVGSSSPSRFKNFLFSMLSRLALGPTQPPIQWVDGCNYDLFEDISYR